MTKTPELAARLALFRAFGGLERTGVRNDEWLYMLQEETRQSLSIEGYFATDTELEAILNGKKSGREILNYFRTAQHTYDLALQFYRDEELQVNLPMIRHIHSELFRELDNNRGSFRSSPIQIKGAKIKPPAFGAEDYVRAFLEVLPLLQREHDEVLPRLARIHTLFEAIHPFSDGNGRTGRILLNYLAICWGFPPLIIKGEEKEQRDRYYEALEAADKGFHGGFPPAEPQALLGALEQGHFEPLEVLFEESVYEQLGNLSVTALESVLQERGEVLMTLNELGEVLNVKEATLRQWVRRGKLLALKRSGKLYSHPQLQIG